MKVYIALTLIALATSSPLREEEWNSYKNTYNKVYKDYREDRDRRAIFEAELDIVEAHNAKFVKGLVTYTVGINQFSDWTDEEWNAFLTAKAPVDNSTKIAQLGKVKASSAWDWRDHGIVNQPKNQGNCGSCWAFAATGAVEGAWAKAGNPLVSLSEQELVDCGTGPYGGSCNGGWTSGAYNTIIAMGGQELEETYPYEGVDGYCRYNSNNAVAHISDYYRVPTWTDGETSMIPALFENGPITVLIDANRNWGRYDGGVFYDPSCSQDYINHAVLAVGYDISSSYDSKKYWIVKNSWGTSWGEGGYIKMRYNVNQCNMACCVDYPIL